MPEQYVSFWENPPISRVQTNNNSRESPSGHIGIYPTKKGDFRDFPADFPRLNGGRFQIAGNTGPYPPLYL